MVSCTIDIRVPVTLKETEVRKMCEDKLEDENGRIEIHMISDLLFFEGIPAHKRSVQGIWQM